MTSTTGATIHYVMIADILITKHSNQIDENHSLMSTAITTEPSTT